MLAMSRDLIRRQSNRDRDRREWWASPERESVVWEALTRGERTRRSKFFRMVGLGVNPVEAIRDCLDLKIGPIPDYQTKEEYDAAWAEETLSEVADRWRRSAHFRGFAKDQTELARADLCSRAAGFAKKLWDVANDPEASHTAVVKACQVALNMAGLVAGDKPLANVTSLKDALKKKTRAIVEASRKAKQPEDEIQE